ncbi:MAG: sulfotransferase family protein [Pirellulales bacterium]|nr:sulfotransferase family protein [Pirellulales bacterium]
MSLDSEIIIVSGLPRSGTSLMMQMLHVGGVEVVTDHVRTADVDNPRGYFEFERAKQIEHDTSWLPSTRGKAFKMVSQLLYHLPPREPYRIIFMQRDLDEILISQEKMLQRREIAAAPREKIKEAFTLHLERLFEWLHDQRNISVLTVNYNELLDNSRQYAETISEFLGNIPVVPAMVQAIDPNLYRNRRTTPQSQNTSS